MPTLSTHEARRLLLAAQGLAAPPKKAATKESVRAAIRQMQVLQIDTISVVARSPYLVLWSRLGMYDGRWLEELLAEGALFEYWAHAACFLPIEDYPYFRRLMADKYQSVDEGGRVRYISEWMTKNPEMAESILTHVRENGEVRSADFERKDGQVGSWWNWKVEKLALEVLFDVGHLMVARRHNFQRVYNLRERVVPHWDDAHVPTTEEMERTFIMNTVKSLGVTKADWIADYYRLSKKRVMPHLPILVDEGLLRTVEVEGWKTPGYVHPDNWQWVEKPPQGNVTTLLSPFDPVVWDRKRASELFGFDYRIEVYTPAPKRVYGYFTLPILHRGALVGRLDPKAHRKEGRFEIRALHLEPGVAVTDELVKDLAATIQACADWHQTPTVEIVRSDPPALAELVRRAL